jgi:hypothetical protein
MPQWVGFARGRPAVCLIITGSDPSPPQSGQTYVEFTCAFCLLWRAHSQSNVSSCKCYKARKSLMLANCVSFFSDDSIHFYIAGSLSVFRIESPSKSAVRLLRVQSISYIRQQCE